MDDDEEYIGLPFSDPPEDDDDVDYDDWGMG